MPVRVPPQLEFQSLGKFNVTHHTNYGITSYHRTDYDYSSLNMTLCNPKETSHCANSKESRYRSSTVPSFKFISGIILALFIFGISCVVLCVTIFRGHKCESPIINRRLGDMETHSFRKDEFEMVEKRTFHVVYMTVLLQIPNKPWNERYIPTENNRSLPEIIGTKENGPQRSNERKSRFAGVVTSIYSMLRTNHPATLQNTHFWIVTKGEDVNYLHSLLQCAYANTTANNFHKSPKPYKIQMAICFSFGWICALQSEKLLSNIPCRHIHSKGASRREVGIYCLGSAFILSKVWNAISRIIFERNAP